MKKLFLWLRTSPLMLTLLSLGIAPPPSVRVVKVPIAQPDGTTGRCTSRVH
jgi:hypothetical protein